MTAGALDRLADRLQTMVLEVHENLGSGVERFRVTSTNPLRLAQLGGELELEDGDPDFTVGETLRGAVTAGDVQTGHLVWVARQEQEWHAFDVVGNATTGTARDATSLQGRAVSNLPPGLGNALLWTGSQWAPASLPSSMPPSGAAGGDLRGNYPNPTGVIVPNALVYRTAVFPIPGTSTLTPITWDATEYAVGGMTVVAGGIKVPKAGVYHASFTATWSSFTAPAGNRQWAITKNSAAFVQAGTSNAASTEAHMPLSMDIDCAANDVISAAVLCAAANSVAATPWTMLSLSWKGYLT